MLRLSRLMPRRLSLLFVFIVAALRAAEPTPEVAARIARIESGLLPAAHVSGTKLEPWSIEARMQSYKVPGLSIAVLNDGAIEWARGYGLARVGSAIAVTPSTLFQGATLSLPLTAAAALNYVDAGQLELDADINAKLTSWKLPPSEITAGVPVTLRQLLGHAAGISSSTFNGYAPGIPVPSLLDVLDGRPPARSPAVRVTLKPGAQWRFAPGGYAVVQQLLTDVTKKEFPVVMRERVLGPSGMADSTFEQPLSDTASVRAASGHRADGTRMPGGYNVFPEMAADGLWSTPTDLARFVITLRNALNGKLSILRHTTAETMLTPVVAGSDYGLGFGVKGEGDALSISHSGSCDGFRCTLIAYPRTGRGVIVMANSDAAAPLINEVIRAVAKEYAWPDYQMTEKEAFALEPKDFDPYIGRYQREETKLLFYRTGNRYFVKAEEQPRVEIFPQSDHEFFILGQAATFSFERDDRGVVTHVIRRTSPPQLYFRVP